MPDAALRMHQAGSLAQRAMLAYPEGVAVVPLLHLAAVNRNEARLEEFLPYILGALALAVAVHLTMMWILRKADAAALWAAALLGLTVALGQIQFFASRLLPSSWGPVRQADALVAVAVAALCGVLVLVLRRPNALRRMRPILALTVGAALVVQVPPLLVSAVPDNAEWQEAWPPEAPVGLTRPGPTPPDVYYIIFDMYGGQDALQSVFGFDNSPFTRNLEGRGFHVVPHARSNYDATHTSIPSSLSMSYLEGLAGVMGAFSLDRAPLNAVMEDNPVRQGFAGLGYRTVNIMSGDHVFPTLRDGETKYDTDVVCLTGSGVPILVRQTTALRLLPRNWFGDAWLGRDIYRWSFDHWREGVECSFDAITRQADDPDPTFVFAHIMSPHHPYVYAGPDCTELPFRDAWNDEILGARPLDWQPFVQQVECLNEKILDLVDELQSRSTAPPIIILQGDHGTSLRFTQQGPEAVDPDWVAKQFGPDGRPSGLVLGFMEERSNILNALYLPGLDSKDVPDGITPVNTFRFVFSEYFGGEFDLLENQVRFGSYSQPYSTFDIGAYLAGG